MSLGAYVTVELLAAGAVVGLDNLAAALALGSLGQAGRVWRIAPVFAVFGALSPLVGALIGDVAAGRLAGYGDLLGIIILAGLGIWVLVASVRGSAARERMARRTTSGLGLLLLAAGLSVDNLVVGFGLGLRGVPPLPLAVATGAFVLGFTVAGLMLGRTVGQHWEVAAQRTSGVLLLGLATFVGFGWV
ncbi:hypothetical protein BH23GEM3_BH23GEM3_12570 [soil metagenome]